MSVNGVAPVVSPIVVIFVLVFVAGALMAVLWRGRRNLLLVRKGFNPFSFKDFATLMNADPARILPGEKPFLAGRYGRISLGLMLVGGLGTAIALVARLFLG